ncbi:MAG TPA: PhzF family phenazine biosynthesis protein [Permianibacter sp.]|nr:PhzF family phenazine biosynthesis protein [Permianibacter sp.]
MQVQKWAAFSDGIAGGNPAGIVLAETFPSETEMRALAAELGFSETAFAVQTGERWRVRYFSPESEVPFCGHATIALGAALATGHGDGRFDLSLNHGDISVEGRRDGALVSAALQSPPTRSRALDAERLAEVLAVFGYREDQLDPRLPPAWIHGGADHVALCLRSRADLSALHYDLDRGRMLMNREGWVTVLFAVIETPQRFHTRNAFASGGVYEDPATGAATAAFAGYLRDVRWPHQGAIDLIQGEDMGMRSLLHADIPATPGSSIRVSGTARLMS